MYVSVQFFWLQLSLSDVKNRAFPWRMFFKGKWGTLVPKLPPCLTLDIRCVSMYMNSGVDCSPQRVHVCTRQLGIHISPPTYLSWCSKNPGHDLRTALCFGLMPCALFWQPGHQRESRKWRGTSPLSVSLCHCWARRHKC